MNNKHMAYETYNKIADWFDENRSRDLFEKPYLDMVMSYLNQGAKVLDVGCGIGEPIAKYFADQGFDLTGIDGSQKMIDIAKSRMPEVRFIVCDMRELSLEERFDSIIAWHSFFHLPPEDQRKMFCIFEKHMNPNGVLIFTSGPDEGEVWSENGGENLYHASLSVSEYKELLTAHNFEIITHKIEDEECGGATVWVARYGLGN